MSSASETIKKQYKNGRKVNCKIYDIPLKEDIYFLYNERQLSLNKVSKIFDTTIPTLKKWMIGYKIHIRTQSENKKIQIFSKSTIPNEVYTCINNREWLKDAYDIFTANEISNILSIKKCVVVKKITDFNLSTPRSKTLTIDEFINKSNNVHDNKYDYSCTIYTTSHKRLDIICPIHGLFSQYAYYHVQGAGCPKCGNNISKNEIELQKHIKKYFNKDFDCNIFTIISPKELDIYEKTNNIAIEMNGIYHHSEQKGKDKSYHLNKTEECEKLGIQLFHIFENEWLVNNTKNIWKSVINNSLNIYDLKIGARQTYIREISSKTSKEFFDNNHLQGNCNGSINIGLYNDNILVSCMSFCKSRFNKKYDWELLRFCNKLNTVVIGGASKLLKYFRTNHKGTIISYANRRWSQGDLYEKLGFKFVKCTIPNYFYFKLKENPRVKLYNRIQFQKHKLKDKLDIFDENLTEYQNMLNNGYDRIWDCGNKVYELIDI